MRLVSALAFTFLVVGCADKGDEGFFIRNNTAPPIGGTGCTFTGDPAQPAISAGAISYLSPGGYVFTPLLESRITAVMGMESERTIHLEGANVTLTAAATGAKTNFTALFAGSLAPNGGTTNVSFELLPKASIMMLGSMTANAEVVALVAPYGTLGGGRLDGEPFQYPITIIAPTNGIVTTVGSCASSTLPSSATPPNPCNPYQDGVIDCCSCKMGSAANAATTLECPAATDTTNCM